MIATEPAEASQVQSDEVAAMDLQGDRRRILEKIITDAEINLDDLKPGQSVFDVLIGQLQTTIEGDHGGVANAVTECAALLVRHGVLQHIDVDRLDYETVIRVTKAYYKS